MDDHYATLGVPPDASDEAIKQAYRKLAVEWHPDRNSSPEAENRFKSISAAYEVLKHADKRQQYDASRSAPGGVHFGPGFANGGFDFGFDFARTDFINIDELLRNADRRRYQEQQRRNRDISVAYQISLEEAFTGKETEIHYVVPGQGRKSAKVKIPAGIEHGNKIRYAQAGHQGDDSTMRNQPPGDLYVVVQILPHRTFTRRGADLLTNLDVDAIDAMTGHEAEIVGIDGTALRVFVPEGIQHGSVIRLTGKGMSQMRRGDRGDLFLTVRIVVPKLTEHQRSLLRRVKEQPINIHE